MALFIVRHKARSQRCAANTESPRIQKWDRDVPPLVSPTDALRTTSPLRHPLRVHALDTNCTKPLNNDVTFHTVEGASTVAVWHVLVDTRWEGVGPFLHPNSVSSHTRWNFKAPHRIPTHLPSVAGADLGILQVLPRRKGLTDNPLL